MPQAKQLFEQQYPLALLQEGVNRLGNSSLVPTQGLMLVLAASAYKDIYLPRSVKVHGIVRSVAETLISGCQLDKAPNLEPESSIVHLV